MNIEAIGIGILCVSQGLMWWRSAHVMRRSFAANAAAVALLTGTEARAVRAAYASEAMQGDGTATLPMLRSYLEGISNDLNLALQRLDALPKRRNTRKALPPAATTEAIGRVSS